MVLLALVLGFILGAQTEGTYPVFHGRAESSREEVLIEWIDSNGAQVKLWFDKEWHEAAEGWVATHETDLLSLETVLEDQTKRVRAQFKALAVTGQKALKGLQECIVELRECRE